MPFPRKFQRLHEIDQGDVTAPDYAYLVYAVCACEEDSCGWQGWTVECAFEKTKKRHLTGTGDRHLPGHDASSCPTCGKQLYRTGAEILMVPAEDQNMHGRFDRDYETIPIRYDDEPSEEGGEEDDTEAREPVVYTRQVLQARDALTALTGADDEDDEIDAVVDASASVRDYPRHKVVVPYVGQPYDPAKFTLEKGAWDHEHCEDCGATLSPGQEVWVSDEPSPDFLCDACREKC